MRLSNFSTGPVARCATAQQRIGEKDRSVVALPRRWLEWLGASLYVASDNALNLASPMITIPTSITESKARDISPSGIPRPHRHARYLLTATSPALVCVRDFVECANGATRPVCAPIPTPVVASLLPPELRATATACLLYLPRAWAFELPALLASELFVCNLHSPDLLQSVTSVVLTGPRRALALDAIQLPISGALDDNGFERFVIIVVCGTFVHVLAYDLDDTFVVGLQAACACAGRNFRPYVVYTDEELERARIAAAANPDFEEGPARATMLTYRALGPESSDR